jgi:hypothetical protein
MARACVFGLCTELWRAVSCDPASDALILATRSARRVARGRLASQKGHLHHAIRLAHEHLSVSMCGNNV